jgi:hypothetical protein
MKPVPLPLAAVKKPLSRQDERKSCFLDSVHIYEFEMVKITLKDITAHLGISSTAKQSVFYLLPLDSTRLPDSCATILDAC